VEMPAVPAPGTVLEQARSENFTVASHLLPRRIRRDLLAIYGFARLVDDLGDEAEGDRMALLDWLEGEIAAVYQGWPSHPLLRRLVPTVRAHDIPREPFLSLIEANRRDQVVHSYATFDDLLDYCRLSANPVGHLVLYVADAATPRRIRLSDDICTALQLVEHLQDVPEDHARGRVYLPEQDMAGFGVDREELAAGSASPALRRLVAFEAGRARELLDRGAPLASTLRGRVRLAIHGFVAGGRAALDAMDRAGFDVLAATPRAGTLSRARWFLFTALRPARR
jgi:squalene synthase HpnC